MEIVRKHFGLMLNSSNSYLLAMTTKFVEILPQIKSFIGRYGVNTVLQHSGSLSVSRFLTILFFNPLSLVCIESCSLFPLWTVTRKYPLKVKKLINSYFIHFVQYHFRWWTQNVWNFQGISKDTYTIVSSFGCCNLHRSRDLQNVYAESSKYITWLIERCRISSCQSSYWIIC